MSIEKDTSNTKDKSLTLRELSKIAENNLPDLIERHNNGESFDAIGVVYGVSGVTIYNIFKRNDIPTGRVKKTAEPFEVVSDSGEDELKIFDPADGSASHGLDEVTPFGISSYRNPWS